jgi:hypothetical protein
MIGPDHTGHDSAGPQNAVVVEIHDHGERETIHARIERTDVVGQVLGQHREHAVHEVDGGRSLARLLVDRRAPWHVVAHVGDMHAHTHEPIHVLDRDRIVKVACVNRINRDDASHRIALALGLDTPLRLRHPRPSLKDYAHVPGIRSPSEV